MSPINQLPDFEDKNAMLILLRAYLKGNGDGTWTYDPEWSDLLIAENCTPNIKFQAHHVGAVRRMKFGPLAHPAKRNIEPEPLPPSRMDILEQRLSRVIDILSTNSPRSAQHRRYLLDGSSSTAHLDDI